jgi:hypothetical protein
VTIRILFPEVELAERATEGLQQRLQETTFEALVLDPIQPRITQAVERRPLEISSLLEIGRFSLLDEDGLQVAFKALAERSWESKLTLSLNAGYEHFSLDDLDGDGNGYLINLGAHREFLNGLIKAGGLLTWQFVEAEILGVSEEINSFGAGVFAAVRKDFGPVILSGGLLYKFLQDTGDSERSNHLLSYGMEVGVPIGQQFVVNLEVFQINDLERDEDPLIVGASVSFFATPRWGVTLGWKTILNIDGLTSHEGIVGASGRF